MNTPRNCTGKRGFTLMELLVAMAITTIIVTVLISITSIAIDTWNRSRAELRSARQAKAMVDTLARDLETLVIRRGNENEWLGAKFDAPELSANASRLVFFTGATDRYGGLIGGADDKGGDVSSVGYVLAYKDPINGGTAENQTMVLNRYLVNPDETFNKLLGKTTTAKSLISEFQQFETQLNESQNFICENVYQFTLTFKMEVTKNTNPGDPANPLYQKFLVPLSISETSQGQKIDEFRMLGTGLVADVNQVTIGSTTLTPEEIKSGRLAVVEISLTVLSDAGVDLLRRSPARAKDAAWLGKNSFQYSKQVQVPGM
jgi:prepilin-type N-terminal cleavage/methylation domain-containing protein